MATVSDILIIGAGLSGVSLAYELSQKGLQVTVVDSGDVGDRTSATNQGGVRQQFFDRANILAGSKTLEIVAGFETEMGGGPRVSKYRLRVHDGTAIQYRTLSCIG